MRAATWSWKATWPGSARCGCRPAADGAWSGEAATVVIEAISIELLMAVALTALGAFVASHIQRMGGFSVVTQLLLFPMLVISGARHRCHPVRLHLPIAVDGIVWVFAVVFLVLAVAGLGMAR